MKISMVHYNQVFCEYWPEPPWQQRRETQAVRQSQAGGIQEPYIWQKLQGPHRKLEQETVFLYLNGFKTICFAVSLFIKENTLLLEHFILLAKPVFPITINWFLDIWYIHSHFNIIYLFMDINLDTYLRIFTKKTYIWFWTFVINQIADKFQLGGLGARLGAWTG